MSGDKGYRCTLSPESLLKAKTDMNEDPDTRLMEVSVLRDRLKKVTGLTPRTDAKFLLGFLRGHCFDQEKTFKLVKEYYQIRLDKKDIFADLKPIRVHHVIDSKMMDILKHRDNQGRRVLIYRLRLWDPAGCPFYDNMKYWTIVAQRLMEEEETSVNGVRFVYHMEGLEMKHISAVGPLKAKLMITLAFYCFPLHIRRVDFFFENKFFEVLFAIFRPLLDAELMSKIRFNGKDVSALQETMDINHIPTDLGGKEELFANQAWHDEFLEMDTWYEENNKFGFVSLGLENEKKESGKEHAGMTGLGGSFKKLEN